MLCLYCRQPISPIRRLWDTRFCSSGHRDQVLARSARFLREAEDLGCDDPWQEERKRATGQRTSALVFVVLLAIVGTGVFVENSGGPASPDNRLATKPKLEFGNSLRGLLGGGERLSLGDGVQAWRDFTGGSEWAKEGSYVRPGRLRIWAKSETL